MKILLVILISSICAHAAQTNQLQRWKPTDAQPTDAALRELVVSLNATGARVYPTRNGGMLFKFGKVSATPQLQAQDSRAWLKYLTNDSGSFVIIRPTTNSYVLQLRPAAGKTSVQSISPTQWQDNQQAIELFITKTKAAIK